MKRFYLSLFVMLIALALATILILLIPSVIEKETRVEEHSVERISIDEISINKNDTQGLIARK